MIYNHVKVKDIPAIEQITAADGTRVYSTPTGKKYPSVTTILSSFNKQALIEWRKRVGEEEANRISQRATKRGSKLHLQCEDYLNNNNVIDKLTIFDKPLFTSILPLLHRINNVHLQEKRLYSHHLRLAGTVDCIAEFDGRLSVIDYKTSSRKKSREDIPTYFMQCAAYAIMYEELTGTPVDKLVIIMAVEDDDPLLFVEKRNTWVPELLRYRDQYEMDKKLLTT